MASEQTNTHEVMAQAMAEPMRTAIQGMAAAGNERPQNMGPRPGGPTLKQPNFNWDVEVKYNKLKIFRLEINNIFKSYNTSQAEQLAIIKKWLGRKGLQFIELLTETEKERCNSTEGLFTTFNNKFKPKFNKITKSLQVHKFNRQAKENTGEWMGKLRLAAVECNYREVDIQLKEQFIHGLNDNDMLA